MYDRNSNKARLFVGPAYCFDDFFTCVALDQHTDDLFVNAGALLLQ